MRTISTTKRTKRRRKRTGVSLIALLGALAALPAPPSVLAQAAPRKGAEPYAVIAGTVFKESGFSLPGAQVSVSAIGEDQKAKKFRIRKVVTDARGEFAVRVPAEPMRYNVSVKAAGHQPQAKEVEIQGEERSELFFRLSVEAP